MNTYIRKDFRCNLYNDGYEALKYFYRNHKLDPFFISGDAVLLLDQETTLLGLNYILLSENKVRFEHFLKALKYLEQNGYSYHYICIGEEDDDKVELLFNGFNHPPLELESPFY